MTVEVVGVTLVGAATVCLRESLSEMDWICSCRGSERERKSMLKSLRRIRDFSLDGGNDSRADSKVATAWGEDGGQ